MFFNRLIALDSLWAKFNLRCREQSVSGSVWGDQIRMDYESLAQLEKMSCVVDGVSGESAVSGPR